MRQDAVCHSLAQRAGNMTIDSRIAALASDTDRYDGKSRVLTENDGDAALTAMLEEIDIAVLPTILRFENALGVLELVASARRLNVVNEAPASILGHVTPKSQLSMDNDKDIQNVVDVLKSFSDASGALSVTSHLVREDLQNKGAGLSATVLSKALNAPISENPIQDFFFGLDKLILTGILLIDGLIVETVGEARDVALLRIAAETQIANFETARRTRPELHQPLSLTTLDDTGEVGVGTALAVSGSDLAIVSYRSQDAVQLHSKWLLLV